MTGLASSFVPFAGTGIRHEDDGQISYSLVALEVAYR